MNYEKTKEELKKFLRKNLEETGKQNFIIGISGGLDSAIVSALCAEVSIKNTFGLIMPTKTSNKDGLDDAIRHCENFGIIHKLIDIEPMLWAYEKNIGMLSNLRRGNLAARMRMCVLYDTSSYMEAVVVGTSNLSERMLGYGTIYGDLACAFNPIGEIFKSELFEFGKYLGIDEKILKKPPSADLWEGQSDEKDLGYTYKELDKVLRDIYDKDLSFSKLKEKHDKELVSVIKKRMVQNSFKLKLPNIANVRKYLKEK
ncbi:NAD+ synthase [Campylobacter geochelonis]|uniref:NH(3)-dependent NAD(+) synthetase n=1 Tax=Campylobacter geochelonis TaxID=1780362 RepID=A0A128EEC3_9BACT|nr:NAD+ synthase [Campylobacter geochelonis]QKF71072.1 NAD synthetase, NH3-dependent [Campylobacter geochelonis]CZE47256.1 NAD+ synthetase [Campylobacter geochelonis]CZE48426.1 NAD+ synthetase [Campylobacter geochelonis]CZE50112.1 NAD+ synthetase [Campylobacter geochelonis]